MNRRALAIFQTLAVVAGVAWASVLAKRSLGTVSAFTFVWLQIGLGLLLLTGYTFGWRRERVPRELGWRVWLYMAWIGIGNFTLVRVLFMLGLDLVPATTYAYLVNFTGLVTMAMSLLLLRERPTWLQVAGAVLALVGVRLFFHESPEPAEMRGLLLLGIGILALASTNNATRKLAMITQGRLSNNVLSTVALWIGGVPVVLAGVVIDGAPEVGGLEHWWVIALNALVSIAIGLTVFNQVLRTLRSYEASVLASSGLIWTALFAVPILGERLDGRQIGAIALMMVGIALAQVRRRWVGIAPRGSAGRGGTQPTRARESGSQPGIESPE